MNYLLFFQSILFTLDFQKTDFPKLSSHYEGIIKNRIHTQFEKDSRYDSNKSYRNFTYLGEERFDMTNTKCYWKIIYGKFLNQSLFSIIFLYIRKNLDVMECNAFCRWNTQLRYNIFWWLYLQIKKGIHKMEITNLPSCLNTFRAEIPWFLHLENFPL